MNEIQISLCHFLRIKNSAVKMARNQRRSCYQNSQSTHELTADRFGLDSFIDDTQSNLVWWLLIMPNFRLNFSYLLQRPFQLKSVQSRRILCPLPTSTGKIKSKTKIWWVQRCWDEFEIQYWFTAVWPYCPTTLTSARFWMSNSAASSKPMQIKMKCNLKNRLSWNFNYNSIKLKAFTRY